MDVIFTSQRNTIMNSGAQSKLHSNCHHQIICAKFDLKAFYHPPYEGTAFHGFSKSCIKNILKTYFTKSFFSVFLSSLFKKKRGFSQASWLNLMAHCTFFNTNTQFRAGFNFLMCIKYSVYETS